MSDSFVMTEFPVPQLVLYFGSSGRPSKTVHLSDTSRSTLCGQHGPVSTIDVAGVPQDWVCQKCALASESAARYHRLT